jgi:hypothetical protein
MLLKSRKSPDETHRSNDFDPTAVEMKRQEHRRAMVISIEFDLNAHGLLSNEGGA